MKTYYKYITLSLFVTALTVNPLLSYAKENGKGNSNHQEQRSEKSDDRGRQSSQHTSRTSPENLTCARAYGHLFSSGWNKKNNSSEYTKYISDNCYFPFGITKKFRGHNAPTTPDTTAPVISSVRSNAGRVQADIRWTTDEYADSTVFWGTSSSVDTSDSANKTSNTRLTKGHQVILKNLTSNTTYYFVVRSKDVSGNQSLSSVSSFQTKIASTTDTQLPTISSVFTIVGTTTLNIGWKTNEPTTDRVYYSTSLPVTINASSTAYVSNASSTKIHNLQIPSLAAGTTYYLVIESTDLAGNVSTSATFSAKTLGSIVVADTTGPVLSSIVVTSGASTSTISWVTDEPSTSKVFYSTTTPIDIGSASTAFVLNSSLSTIHSISLSGLATSTTYYFKVQSADASNNVTSSSEFSTTTLGL